MRSWALLFVALLVAGPAAGQALPPLSYTCPMHPEVVDDKPGACPRCGMPLEPVRLDTAYSCPVHTSVIEAGPGRCPVCRRDLVPITVTLSFTCPGQPAVRRTSPGACSDGSRAAAVRERRVHGDHNPRHGGQFFMAPDNWHHLEGTYPSRGLFRVYVYDDFTRPLSKQALRDVRGRASVSDDRPSASQGTEAHAVSLTVSKDGRALEARLDAPVPARISLRLSFAPGDAGHRFDFSFPSYTSEAKPGRPATAAPAAARPPALAPPPADAATALQDLLAQRTSVDAAVASGAYGSIYIPALAAKDAALRLDSLAAGFDDARRVLVSSAVKRVVVAAWQLDMYGDLGDRRRIEEANRELASGIDALLAAYGR